MDLFFFILVSMNTFIIYSFAIFRDTENLIWFNQRRKSKMEYVMILSDAFFFFF